MDILKTECLDYLRYDADRTKYFPEQIAILLKKYADIPTLIDKIISCSPKDKKRGDAKEILNELNIFLGNDESRPFDATGPQFKEKILKDYETIKSSYKKVRGSSDEDLFSQVLYMIDMVKEKKCGFDLFNNILKSKFSLFEYINEKNIKKKNSTAEDKLNYPLFFAWGLENIYPYIQEALDINQIFNNIAFDIHEKAKTKLVDEDLFTFDDILIKMNEAIKTKGFRDKVQMQYQAAIVDEFQDTDPVQWNIFKSLFFSEGNNLKAFYLVGDPKQSIYSFRNADLNTYFSAAKYLGEGSKYFLNTNYRSDPSLIKSLNFMFSNEFISNWINIPKLEMSLPYTPVNPGIVNTSITNASITNASIQNASITNTSITNANINDVTTTNKNVSDEHICSNEKIDITNECKPTLFVARDRSSKIKKWPSKSLEKECLFPFIADEIINLTRRGNCRYEDIAILVKDRYQANSMNEYLQNRGIPAYARAHQPITSTIAFAALEEIMEAATSPHNLNKVKVAIAGPYIRWDDMDIKDGDITKCVKLFCELNEILKTQGLPHFFRRFLHSSWNNEKGSVLDNLLNCSDLSLYQHTVQLIEIIIEKQNNEKLTSEGIVSLFKELKQQNYQNNELLTITPTLDLSAIQIMTIHMSKGLEFEAVFALGACNRQLITEEIEENNAEKFRQLYVALTRAKKKLYIPFVIDENEKGYIDNTYSSMELFFLHALKENISLNNISILEKIKELQEKEIVRCEFIEQKKEKGNNLNDSKQPLLEPLFPIKINKTHGVNYSFSSLTSNKKIDADAIEKQNEEITFSAKALTPGPEFGKIIHRIFERVFSGKQRKFYDTSYISSIINEEIENTCFIEKQDLIFQMIHQAIHAPLPMLGFSLKDVSIENIFVETEFLYPYKDDSSFMKGFVDLIFYHNNKYYLVDWKTNWLGDEYSNYTDEKIIKAMDHHEYFLQASIYSEALKKYLKIIDDRSFQKINGGAIYLFLRGINLENKEGSGIIHFMPNQDLIETV